jgi:hypothetical protein
VWPDLPERLYASSWFDWRTAVHYFKGCAAHLAADPADPGAFPLRLCLLNV